MSHDITATWMNVAVQLAEDNDKQLYWACKRCFDVVVASIMLVMLAPLMLAIAICIKLDSSGPVLFVQQRVGARRRVENGHVVWEVVTFPFFKFRSMSHKADESLHAAFIKAFAEGTVDTEATDGKSFKLHHDPRVTRFGHYLRKSSLDELPQLFNVLRGEMSLVGPRPVPVYEAEEFRGNHWKRLMSLPGMTGLWQVEGRCLVGFEEAIEMDLDYVRRQSMWLDIKLMFLTIPAVLSGRGAG